MVLTTGFISVWLTLGVGFPPLSLSLNQNILVRNLCSLFYRDSDGVVAPSLRTSFDYIDFEHQCVSLIQACWVAFICFRIFQVSA